MYVYDVASYRVRCVQTAHQADGDGHVHDVSQHADGDAVRQRGDRRRTAHRAPLPVLHDVDVRRPAGGQRPTRLQRPPRHSLHRVR